MEKNAFKDLEKELEKKFTSNKDDSIKTQVKGSLDSLGFLGDLFDLYLSKLFSILIGKGRSKKDLK